MTGRQAAPVRVRVTLQRDWDRKLLGTVKCPSCQFWVPRISPDYAQRMAAVHASTCPAFKLAALVRELETLRDKLASWAAADAKTAATSPNQQVISYAWGLDVARRGAADDLTAILTRLS